jgi:hypothetical protein
MNNSIVMTDYREALMYERAIKNKDYEGAVSLMLSFLTRDRGMGVIKANNLAREHASLSMSGIRTDRWIRSGRGTRSDDEYYRTVPEDLLYGGA